MVEDRVTPSEQRHPDFSFLLGIGRSDLRLGAPGAHSSPDAELLPCAFTACFHCVHSGNFFPGPPLSS